MKCLKYIFLVLPLLLFFIQPLSASHALGGELRYEDLGSNNYRISFYPFRDCSGIDMPVVQDLVYTSILLGSSTTISLTQNSNYTIQSTCPSVLTSCQDINSLIFGFQKYSYSAIVHLNPAPDWIFETVINSRSSIVTNVINPDATGMKVIAMMDNQNVTVNNSPVFSNDPVLILFTNTNCVINNSIYDPDGDSIAIEFIPAVSDSGFLNYQPGYTFDAPISVSGQMILDSSNGDIYLTPSANEVDMVVLLVKKFRNGLLIGQTRREMAIRIESGGNHLPTINYSFPFIATACYGDTVHLPIFTSDVDLIDSTFIDSTFSDLPAGSFTFNISSDKNQFAELIFFPDSSHIRSKPYLFNIRVHDNACTYNGIQGYSFRLYVNSCGAMVWPGDADTDLDCDINDILPIGIAYGSNGPARVNASANWIGQPATLWSSDFISGVNYMNADCNGDGMVDSNDVNALNFNSGLTHSLKVSSSQNAVQTAGTIYLQTAADTLFPGANFDLNILLGDSISPVNNIYGICFRVTFDPQIIDSSHSSLQVLSSWFGDPSNDLLKLTKANWSLGYVDFGLVRKDHVNTSGNGQICTISFSVKQNSPLGLTTVFNVVGLKAIQFDENEISLGIIEDSITVAASTSAVNELSITGQLDIFPNPVFNLLHVRPRVNSQLIIAVEIYNNLNQLVLLRKSETTYSSEINVDVSQLRSGLYEIRLLTSEGIIRSKLIKI